jgi:uncharacterized protein (DUF2147 family)
LAALLLMVGPAWAVDPIGEWLVADGVAKVKIDNCDNRLWGIIAWEKEPGGLDQNNPDPAKRRRPTLGMPILIGLQQTAQNRWDGEIYNPQNGKNYTANISLASPSVLRVQGCVLGFLCGGQEWTRVQSEASAAAPAKTVGSSGAQKPVAAPKPAGSPGAQKPASAPKSAGAAAKPADPTKDVCAAVAEASSPERRPR